MTELPEDVKEAFVKVASEFMVKTGANFDEVKDFMAAVIAIYHNYMVRPKSNVKIH